MTAAAPVQIVVMDGDQTGQELLEQSLRVLDPELLGLELELHRYDLTLEHRRATNNEVVVEAAAAMRSAGLGLKAATITPEADTPSSAFRAAFCTDELIVVCTGVPATPAQLPAIPSSGRAAAESP